MPDEFTNVYEEFTDLNDLPALHATILVISNEQITSNTAPTQLAICAAPTPEPTHEVCGSSNETSDTAAPMLAICAPPAPRDEPHGGATSTGATPAPTDEPDGATHTSATPAPVNKETEVDFAAAAAAVQSSLSQSNDGKDVFNDLFDSGSNTGGVDESTPVNSQEKTKTSLSASPIVSSMI